MATLYRRPGLAAFCVTAIASCLKSEPPKTACIYVVKEELILNRNVYENDACGLQTAAKRWI